jgi:glycosyltransferase involved in cell wall biosynthesis
LADGRPDFLTPPGDVEVLGHAMARALKDKNTWRSLSDAARARAEQFSWDAVAEQYEAVLARAAEMKATA